MKKIAAFVLVIVLLLAFTLIVSASSSYTSCDVSDASVASVDKGIHNKTTKYGLPTY